MVRKIALALFALAVLGTPLVFVLRARPESGPAGPRAAIVGEDPCAACLMLVSDARFAAERVLGPEQVKVYDDPGCLLRELARDRSGALFFADARTGEWIPGAEVRFETTTQTTPMGYGLAASREGPIDLETAIRRVQDAAKEKN
jgi:hypothetical protein